MDRTSRKLQRDPKKNLDENASDAGVGAERSPVIPPWPAVVSGVAGLGALYTLPRAWRHRDRPGGWYWIAFTLAIAGWALSYGVALLVFDPVTRRAVGSVTWVAKSLVPPTLLGFALAYTGRPHLVRSLAVRLNVGLWVGFGLFELLNPLHGLVWRNYRIDPVFGAATVSLDAQPALYAIYGLAYVEVGLAVALLLQSVARYGSVYRRQLLTLSAGAALPTAATAVWLFELGPVSQLNPTPATLAVTAAGGYVALSHADLFAVGPATRRAADRDALDDLGSAVAVVTVGGRVVEVNDSAERLFDLRRPAVLGEPLSTVVDLDPETLTAVVPDRSPRVTDGGAAVHPADETPLDTDDEPTDADTEPADDSDGAPPDGVADQTVSLDVDGDCRAYVLNTSLLTDPTGQTVGATLVFQDVTEERAREQRLEVLNRVLRHNLRNDLNVVQGYLAAAADRVDDEETRTMIETARTEAASLASLGEKARSLERLLDTRETPSKPVSLAAFLDRVADEWVPADAADRVTLAIPSGVRVETNPDVLSLLLGNLLENAVEHTPPDTSVRVELQSTDDDSVAVTVDDDGPGVPSHELAAVERGRESQLEHGSGLGLWLVEWSTTALGGDVCFDCADGTSVTVTVPGLLDDGSPSPDTDTTDDSSPADTDSTGATTDRETESSRTSQ